MPGLQFRLRTLLIAIAVLAPVFTIVAWLHQLSSAMRDFYGPRGKLALEAKVHAEAAAGFRCLIEHRPAEAEAHYRSALVLSGELRSTMAWHGWHADLQTSRILIGLADSLVAQNRGPEAATLLEQYATRTKDIDHETVEELLLRARAIRAEFMR